MTTPTAFFDVAQSALDCVCAQMDLLAGTEDGYPGCSCLAYVSAGEPSIDCCVEGGECSDNGMLTVHIEEVYPSDNFPGRSEGFEPCKAATWVATLVVTAARCAPSMDEHGNPAASADLSDNALLMALDQYAILTALGCCLVADAPGNKRYRRVQITGTRPLVSEGGCASVEVRASVDLGPVCGCPSDVS